MLAQPPLPAAPSLGGHQAKEELGAMGARGHREREEGKKEAAPVLMLRSGQAP